MTLPDFVKGRYAGSSVISMGRIHTALAHIKKYCEATFDGFQNSRKDAHLMCMQPQPLVAAMTVC